MNSIFAAILAVFTVSGDAPAVPAGFNCNPTWVGNKLIKTGKCDLRGGGNGFADKRTKKPNRESVTPAPEKDKGDSKPGKDR
jgi:hypothetical protein